MIATNTSSQVWKQISPIVRKSISHLCIYRLGNCSDPEGVVEELSATCDKKTPLQIYHEAACEEYTFLYVNRMSKDKRKIFPQRFDIYLIPSSNYFHTYIFIMTALTNSEGKVLTYTGYFY